MEEENKMVTRTAEMRNLCLGISSNRSSRDLLQSFVGSGSEREVIKDEEEVELNLGLSLGGRFGVDKSSKKLLRSSSIDGNDAVAPPMVAYTGLVRTSSLPAESEEAWRKRKELQMLRRMEAKRRRSEKQRSLKGDKEGGGDGGRGSSGINLSLEEKRVIEVNLRERLEKEKLLAASKKFDSPVVVPPFGLSSWATAATSQAILEGGIDLSITRGKGSSGIQEFGQSASQGSVESKGGSSSTLSELESKSLQGSSSGGELSPASIQSLQEGSNPNAGSFETKTRANMSKMTGSGVESPSNRPNITRNRGREIGKSTVQDMPCVFTKGNGPNGRRVDGILYKYGKGEEVRIMCVCHGSFFSPAEFVKHAGGSDVDQPLKHIVVNPNSSSLL